MNETHIAPKAETPIPQIASTVDTLSELRVKVAELCGWKRCGIDEVPHLIYWEKGIVGTNGYERTNWIAKLDEAGSLPNYPSDLNACAELEKSLTDKERFHYLACLTVLLGYDRTLYSSREFGEFSRAIRNARADQLCRAFVKTRKASVAKHADSVDVEESS